MEILIQTKRRMFSFGTKGFRKVIHSNWNDVQETFETLTRLQTSDTKAKLTELKSEEMKLRNEVEGWTVSGPTASQLKRAGYTQLS